MAQPHMEFEKMTDALALEAQGASFDYQLWRNLTDAIRRHQTELSQSRVFWQMTFEAHFNSCLFRLCRIYDHQKDSLNLSRWLKLIKANPTWFSEAAYKSRQSECEYRGPPDTTQLADDIAFVNNKTNPLVKNLTAYRSNVLAHIGRKYVLCGTGVPVAFKLTYGNVKTLVQRSMKIVNRYTQLYNGSSYSVNMAGIDDFRFILHALRDQVNALRERD